MDVYSDPPSYQDIANEDISTEQHGRFIKTKVIRQNNIRQNQSESSLGVTTPKHNRNVASDSRLNDKILSRSLHEPVDSSKDSDSRINENGVAEFGIIGEGSPLTESICIQMLNEESFASTTTNNTTANDNNEDNDSILDDVFVISINQLDKTVIEVDGHCNDTKISNVKNNDVIGDKCDIKHLQDSDDDKVIVCITEKSQMEELFTKKCGSNLVDNNNFVIYPSEPAIRCIDGEVNPAFLNDKKHPPPQPHLLTASMNTYPTKDIIITKETHAKPGSKHLPTRRKSIGEHISNRRLSIKSVLPPITWYYKKGEMAENLPPKPKDYIVLSCLVLVCCANPLGLISFLFSVLVNTSYEKGEHKRSKRYSVVSYILSILGILTTISVVIIMLCLYWPAHSSRRLDPEEIN